MRNPALRVFEQAARRAHGRSYSQRAMTLARSWQFPDGAHLLVPAPVFVLTTMKSGSSLLRTALDRHSRICAPHELHLGSWNVSTSSRAAQAAIEADGLDSDQLADLLWDRMLHLHLVRSRKSIIVDKTPRNALLWRRIVAHWPDARFLVFTRHPLRVADDIALARPDIAPAKHHAELERYAVALQGGEPVAAQRADGALRGPLDGPGHVDPDDRGLAGRAVGAGDARVLRRARAGRWAASTPQAAGADGSAADAPGTPRRPVPPAVGGSARDAVPRLRTARLRLTVLLERAWNPPPRSSGRRGAATSWGKRAVTV